MLFTKFLIAFVALHFLKYANRTKSVNLQAWIDTLCTPQIIAFARITIILDLIRAIITYLTQAIPAFAGIFLELMKIGM